MDDREAILRNMNDFRFLVLCAMADLEEEQGDARRARGWRWLAENGRWPLEVVRYDIDEEPEDGGPPKRLSPAPGTLIQAPSGATFDVSSMAPFDSFGMVRRGGPAGQQTPAVREPNAPAWEWWREKDTARFSCSLPAVLMEHVRKAAKTPKGATCCFESASQALGCAATCAGLLIEVNLLE